jgi:SAM-dependent methyltransferase
MNLKNKLKREIWRSDVYYSLAKKGSLDRSHPGMKILSELASKSSRILDLGCGEGTRLNLISDSKRKAVGIDISEKAIELAKKSYPRLKFIVADLEKIPLKDQSFDLVYSAYVLEHLTEPVKVLNEAIRLTTHNGYLVLVAPNYGAPNRASPPFRGSRLLKFLNGVIDDFTPIFKDSDDLDWTKVKPLATINNYDIDWDTTIEPYLRSLIYFLRRRKMIIKKFTTCWMEELPNARIHQVIFRFLGKLGIYPFLMWGPHLVVVAKKDTYES